MISTVIDQSLGLEFPIFQGGMAWVADASLAAGVSNAGGLGIIAAMNSNGEQLREEIRKCKTMTDKIFGVNIMLMSPFAEEVSDVVVEEGIKVITTGAGNPGKYMAKWLEAGIKVIPVVPSVALARKMEKDGAFAVIAEGGESGGHVGDLTTMALVPQVVDAVNIPVIAAGGIADGRQIAAAFMLGAQGVQVGTRFLVAKECTISQEYKNKILKARDIDTVVTGKRLGHPVRSIRNSFTREYTKAEYDSANVSDEELENMGLGRLRRAVREGDVSPAAKAVYEMADSIRENTSKQCFEGTMEELSKTVNTQPCIFTADLAAARALVEKGITPDCVAGFSLGEISALAFSGILSDEQAFRLVCKRGELMDKAATENPGAMAAVLKLTPEKVEEICSRFDKTYPVNYNSPAQTVVATTSENADAFCEAVKADGGRAKLLAVSGAFHSPFMADAAEGLGKYMENVDFAQPKVQIYSDYTAQPYSGDFKTLVKAQVENPVKWQTIVENMINDGVDTFIEVGVGKTLTGLVKRINGDVKAFKVETAADIDALEL